jgi:CheY-like chemotaxis protein
MSRDARRAPLSGLEVLVVDGDAAVRTSIALILRALGAGAQPAASARAAWAAAARRRPDVVITALTLADADAFTLVDGLRERPRSVVALAHRADANLRELARVSGIRCVLEKPVPPDELTQAVAASVN